MSICAFWLTEAELMVQSLFGGWTNTTVNSHPEQWEPDLGNPIYQDLLNAVGARIHGEEDAQHIRMPVPATSIRISGRTTVGCTFRGWE